VSIVDYRPDLGSDYLSLADEVLERLGRDEDRKALAKVRAELAPAA
jgi:chromosome partitioning protein